MAWLLAHSPRSTWRPATEMRVLRQSDVGTAVSDDVSILGA